ncbi:MAG: DNA polymerase III subunit delta [Nitrospiraceae bacterium]
MKADELHSAITKQGIAPLYLVVGEEDRLRTQALATLKAAVLGHDHQGAMKTDVELDPFNYHILYGDECRVADILACAEEAPLFAARRLVLIKAADRLGAREADGLLPYLKTPSSATTLVFVATKLDGRLKFSQALKQSAVNVDCSSLPEAQLAEWIKREAAGLGVALDDGAVQTLKELAASLKEVGGGSLSLVRRELEKLAAYVSNGETVSVQHVEALRGIEPGASVFDLTDAIGHKDRGRALRILARNLEAGEAPLRILGALAWQYRRIWKTKVLLLQGGQVGEAARALRMAPFKVREFLHLFSDSHLRAAFRLFAKVDAALKGGSAGRPARVLESLLLELCAGGGDTPVKTQGKEKPLVDRPQPSERRKTKPIANVKTVRSAKRPTR